MVVRIIIHPKNPAGEKFIPGPIGEEGLPEGLPNILGSRGSSLDPNSALGEGTGPDDGEEPSGGFQALPDETGIEAGMVQQVAERKVAQARKWLNDIAPPPPAPVVGSGSSPDAPDMAQTATAPAEDAAAAPAGGAWPVVKDLARGATEMPRQILGGVRDALQATADLGNGIADEIESKIPLGGFQIFDQEGNFAPEHIPAADPRLAGDKAHVTLPKIKQATTVTGGIVHGVAQFIAGFAGAGKALGGALQAMSKTRAAIQGALADFGAFEGHDGRLSDLIQKFPALKNPVTEFLASKPDDGEAEGRLKRALEGLGVGQMMRLLVPALRYIRGWRRAADAVKPAAAAPAPTGAKPLALLGDETAPATVVAGKTRQRTRQGQEKGIETGVPDDITAKALTEKGLTPLTEGENGVFINFARINTEDDVKRVLADTAEALKGDIDAARRGVRSNKVTQMASGKEDAWKLLSERRRGQPLNAEQSVAARRLWEASAQKLQDIAEVAARDPTPENLYEFRKMMAIHHAIQTQIIAARTETARALQSWRIPVGSSAPSRLKSIENLLLTYGGPEAAELLARKIAAVKNLPEGAAVLDDVVEKGAFAKTMEVTKEVWINSLLGNPTTHIVNMIGNTIGLGQELVERMATGAYSRAIGSGQVAPTEAAAKFFGMTQGMREGWWMMLKALKTGESQFGAQTAKTADASFPKAVSSSTFGLDPNNWLGRFADGLGMVVNMPTRFLTAEDDFFKAVGYRMEVAARSARQATQEVTDGKLAPELLKARTAELMGSPPESIHFDAVDYARYQTYTNEPGKFVKALNKLDRDWAASEHPGEQLGSLFMRMLIPFRNTPSQLLAYTFERTPLAPLMTRYREAIARGGADADIARVRMALGSATLLTVMDLAMDGHLTGGGPQDASNRGTRQTLLRSGWQPYSVKLGDRYFSYRRLDPSGLTLAIGADIAELINNSNLDEDKQDTVFQLAAAAAASFGNAVLDKAYMQSMGDMIDVLHNPERAASWLDRRAAAFEPAMLAQMRRIDDPYARYTHDLVSELRNRTPGLSQDLPAARDMWGRPRDYQSGMGTVYDALSPIYSRKFNPEPIDKAAIANDFNLSMPSWTLSYGTNVNVSLHNRPEAYSRFLEIRGQMKPSEMGGLRPGELPKRKSDWTPAEMLMAKYGDKPLLATLNDMVDGKAGALSKQYDAAGGGRNGGKDKMVSTVIADYNRAAKEKLLHDMPDLAGVVGRKLDKRDASR